MKPLLSRHGWDCVAEEVDTDLLGTFTGEVERLGTVRETLRTKIELAKQKRPQDFYFLASEGSYIPHPHLGFLSIGVESLLFVDKKENIEIYCEYVDHQPVHDERVFDSAENAKEFLSQIGFPAQAVILHPEKQLQPLFKGIQSKEEFERTFTECLKIGTAVKVSTDLRAMHSPRRREAIAKAAEKLVEYLLTDCPQCGFYGFGFCKAREGLLCEECHSPTRLVSSLSYCCLKCEYSEERPRPDGLLYAPPENCDMCNP
ncbi:hypothetical protein K2X05_05980 [bacterium]|nr:hypothetical protein [bacterium]